MPLNFRTAPLQPPRYAPHRHRALARRRGRRKGVCSRRLPVAMTVVDDECRPKLTSTSAETHIDTVRYRHRHRPITISGSPLHAGNQAPWLSQRALQQRRQRQRAACGGRSRGLDGSVCWRASSPLRLGCCYWFSRCSIHMQSSWLSRRLFSASKSRWLPMRLAARWCMRSKKALSPMRCCRS